MEDTMSMTMRVRQVEAGWFQKTVYLHMEKCPINGVTNYHRFGASAGNQGLECELILYDHLMKDYKCADTVSFKACSVWCAKYKLYPCAYHSVWKAGNKGLWVVRLSYPANQNITINIWPKKKPKEWLPCFPCKLKQREKKKGGGIANKTVKIRNIINITANKTVKIHNIINITITVLAILIVHIH